MKVKRFSEKEKSSEEKENKEDENKRNAARLLASSGIVASTGAGLYGASRWMEKELKSGKVSPKRLEQFPEMAETLAKGKKLGKTTMIVGAPLAGLAAYKYYKKNKKKDDN